MNICIIGAGHMGTALASAALQKKLGIVKVISRHQAPEQKAESIETADAVIFAVKPKDMAAAIRESLPHLAKKAILISVAAGVPMAKLKMWTNNHKKIVRVMPNLAAAVNESISVWLASKGLNQTDKKIVEKILNSFGKNIEVKDENLVDMATAIGGGGPAYTAAFLECLAQAAEKIGFTKSQARFLAIEAVDGTLDYIKETGVEFGALKRAVQTKGGTTEAGFRVLKKKKWQATLKRALFAGYRKAQKIAEK